MGIFPTDYLPRFVADGHRLATDKQRPSGIV
jgi:hypothetical protein